MKLDKRIFPAKRPLTCFDSEYAKQFIGKTGFVTNELNQFRDLNQIKEVTLGNVYQTEIYCFSSVTGYKYFLPSEWVDMGEPEKKWRPFSLTEWRHIYAIGDEIVFRIKDSDTCKTYMYCGLISDHDDDLPGKGVINLGGELFVLQNLFDQFELRRNDDWQPFGVLVEGDEK